MRYLEVVNRLLYVQFLLQRREINEARDMLRQALRAAHTQQFVELLHWGLIFLAMLLAHTQSKTPAQALLLWLEAQDLTPQNQGRLKALRQELGPPSPAIRQQAERKAAHATTETWLQML